MPSTERAAARWLVLLGIASGCSAAPRTPHKPAPSAIQSSPARALGAASEALDALDKVFAGGDSSAIAASLRRLGETAADAEAPFVAHVEELVRDLGMTQGDVDAQLRTALRGLARLETSAPDATTRVGIAHRVLSLAVAATGAPPGDEADALASAVTGRLERDFPDDPGALAVRASALRRIEGDLAGALARAERCAAALPICAELAATLKSELAAPRCDAANVLRDFALHRGTREAQHVLAPRRVEVGGAPMWIAEGPALVAADVEALVGDERALLVTLTPASRSKLEPFLTQATSADAVGVVFAGGAPRGAATRLLPMLRGKLLLPSDPRAPLRIEDLCARVDRGLETR